MKYENRKQLQMIKSKVFRKEHRYENTRVLTEDQDSRMAEPIVFRISGTL
jgi:hypothetical protein